MVEENPWQSSHEGDPVSSFYKTPGPAQPAPPPAVAPAAPPVLSVGCIVHYFDSFGPYDRNAGDPQPSPKAAFVTFVHEDEVVDLNVFYPSRKDSKAFVRVSRGTGNGQWDWPARR